MTVGWLPEPRLDLIDLIEGEGKTVLDCGCNTGHTMEELRKRGHTVYGLDIEDNRQTALDAPFVKMDLSKPRLPFVSDDLMLPDYILFGDVLEHLADPIPALKAARSWIGHDGVIIISVPNMGWIGAVLPIANQHFPREDAGHFDRTHLRFYTLDVLLDTVREAGFQPEYYMYRQLPDTTPWPEGETGQVMFRWDNVSVLCGRELYDSLNTYQILLVAKPRS